jgi:hypothetical protein
VRETSLSLPIVRCPGCQKGMDVVASEQAPNNQRMVTYRCSGCRTETVRLAKVDEQTGSATLQT